jgi:uncharacterized protein
LSFYLDTSVLVALFAKEPTVPRIVAVIESHAQTRPIISDWNLTEFAAAISFKLSIGAIDVNERIEILTKFHIATSEMFKTLPVVAEDFTRAATFANQHGLRLRGGDALHLSIAAGRHLRILTLDKRMVAAADTLGIGVIDLP